MEVTPPTPPPNALLVGLQTQNNIHLVIGTNPLAAARCASSLAAGASPVLVAPDSADLHYSLQSKIDDGSVAWHKHEFQDEDLFRLGRPDVDGVVDAVFVTSASKELQVRVSALCKRNRIPVNVVDAPDLCTFSLLSTHVDGPLQIGVTTNGRGCKLASRIRREIASSLPSNLGPSCARLGDLRRKIIDTDGEASSSHTSLDEATGQDAQFNKLVSDADAKTRRMRWLSQVCEYWPLSKLAAITDADIESLFASYTAPSPTPPTSTSGPGRLILAGSGPGHPDLLTRATHKAILTADIILADKLVPAGVLELIPRRTPVHIARKFPGNAEKAQEELLSSALEGVQAGKTVLRLKQGDPFIYGRGGEEVAFFQERGLGHRVSVLPGITSALSAPLFSGIPSTQRDVADQVLICTGTGKKGAAPVPPEFVPTRTVVFLMALHRITGLVKELTTPVELEPVEGQEESVEKKQLTRTLWPLSTPCAVIERASCPDQRVIRTTLAHVAQAIEQEGSRPPGLLVVGNACTFLGGPLEKGRSWSVEEGFRGLDGLVGSGLDAGLEVTDTPAPVAIAAN